MSLLNSEDLIALHEGSAWLMRPFSTSPEDLGPTSYYFHLGNPVADFFGSVHPVVDGTITIESGHSVHVRSVETLNMPWTVYALLGPNMNLVRAGINLICGPAIDPGFTGILEFSLVNLSGKSWTVELGAPIAKAIFFESDTERGEHLPAIARRKQLISDQIEKFATPDMKE